MYISGDRERETEKERQRDKEQRDREPGRQKDREPERQRDKEKGTHTKNMANKYIRDYPIPPLHVSQVGGRVKS